MRTLALIRAAARRHEPDLWPRLAARIAAAEERVAVELPAFTWRWQLVALGAAALPFLVPEPVRFLVASGLL